MKRSVIILVALLTLMIGSTACADSKAFAYNWYLWRDCPQEVKENYVTGMMLLESLVGSRDMAKYIKDKADARDLVETVDILYSRPQNREVEIFDAIIAAIGIRMTGISNEVLKENINKQ